MAVTLWYQSKRIADNRHKEMEKQGYYPTKIQYRNGKYVFSIK